MNLTPTEVARLLEIIFPGLVLLVLVGGIAFRLTVKPTIDAILRLREGLRSDQDQTQQRIARLEDEVRRLRAGELQGRLSIDDGSWARDPVHRDELQGR